MQQNHRHSHIGRSGGRLLLTNLLLCLIILLVLGGTLLPPLMSAARANDEAHEQNLLNIVATEVDSMLSYGQSCVTRIENCEWLYDVFIGGIIQKKPLDIKTKDDILATLRLLRYQRLDVSSVSMFFYDEPETLLTDAGVYEHVSELQSLFPDRSDLRSFALGDGQDGLSTICFNGRNVPVFRARFRDVPDTRYKGELMIVFQPESVSQSLRSKTFGEVQSFELLSTGGECLWRCDMLPATEECASITGNLKNCTISIQVPQEIHQKVYRQTTRFARTGIALNLLCGVVLTLLLTARSYRPIGQVFREVIGDVTPMDDDLAQLSHTFRRIRRDGQQAHAQLDAVLPIAQQRLLKLILDGAMDESDISDAERLSCNLVLDHRLNNVVAVDVSVPRDDPAMPSLYSLDELRLLPPVSESCRAYLYPESRSRCTVLVNYCDEAALSRFIEQLDALLLGFFCQYDPDVMLFYGIGTPQTEIGEICHACSQARMAVRFGLMKGCRTTNFRETEHGQLDGYLFPISDQLRLSDAIADGSVQAAHRQVDYIIRLNTTAKRGNPTNLEHLYADMISTVLRRAGEMCVPCPEMPEAPPTSYAQLKALIDGMIDRICASIHDQQGFGSQYDEILAYIDDTLYDPSISLESIAERFGKSASFISSMFKRMRQMNYIEYVNRKRISRAAELLKESTMNIEEIGAAVGYVSPATFRRNFQKSTGQSPSEYQR